MSRDATLEDLHHVIQIAMGWEDYHLHHFLIGKTYYAGPAPDGSDLDWDIEMGDERKVKLADFIRRKGQRFEYEYDFGDGWRHEILVEKVFQPEPGVSYPVCTAGKRACPPEDCGGAWGYANLLEVMADPDHPDHEELAEWAGEIDPEAFDLDAVNQRLDCLRRK